MELTKVCSRCGVIKPIEEFYGAKGGFLGKRGDCKSCTKIKSKEYISKNKDKITKYQQEYRERNLDSMKHKAKIYYLSNKDTIKEYSNRYKALNKEKVKEYQKDYYNNNRDRYLKHRSCYSLKNKQKEKEYNISRIEKINDSYVKLILRAAGVNDCDMTQDMIDKRRAQIIEYRRKYNK